MADEDHNIVRVYRVHARSNGFDCISPWFLTRDEAVDYPDDDWKNREVEDRRAILVGEHKHVFVASDIGLYNPEHEGESKDPNPNYGAQATKAKTG